MPETPTEAAPPPADEAPVSRNFIQQIIDADIASGKWGQPGERTVVTTRFPPEPNGYLHIGHAKAITLSHGLAREFGGRFMLRFDDTNPAAEEQEYVDSITTNVEWLGARWDGEVRFASDYFEQLYQWARELIEKGLAYVDEQSPEEIRATRGTESVPGTNSPFRDRPTEESLDLFERMKAGEFENGSKVLRAKIDMASPNFNLRDPVMYRIVNTPHHRTGDTWHIYPMYDWAHGLEDSIEGVTHSICTLEFEIHRPLYDWFIDAINKDRAPGSAWGEPIHHPQQIEFARLNPTYIVTSKRKLKRLVDEKLVDGWDDPRMPTISGLKRLGYTPEAITNFCNDLGTTKFNASHDIGKLENACREHLNDVAPRRMAVLRPLKVTITNWGEHGDENRIEIMPAQNHPQNPGMGGRELPFGREIFVERDDFMEDAPKKFFRLKPGGEVRLRYAYWITCQEVVKNDAGEVIELRCTYDPQTRGGDSPPPDADGNVRKVKGTIHWVSARHAVPADVRLFDRLFSDPTPDRAPKELEGEALEAWDFTSNLNPDSLETLEGALLEPALADECKAIVESGECSASWGDPSGRFQLERSGYFCVDPDATADKLVLNRTVNLRDSWAKAAGK